MNSTKTVHPCGVSEVVYEGRPQTRIFSKLVRHTKDFSEYVYTAFTDGEITESAVFRKFHRLWIRDKDIPMVSYIPPEFGVIPESMKP